MWRLTKKKPGPSHEAQGRPLKNALFHMLLLKIDENSLKFMCVEMIYGTYICI